MLYQCFSKAFFTATALKNRRNFSGSSTPAVLMTFTFGHFLFSFQIDEMSKIDQKSSPRYIRKKRF